MDPVKSFRVAVVLLAAGLRWTAADAANPMIGLRPSDGVSMFVKQFSVPSGTIILGAEFENNDPRTVFPEVLLMRGVSSAISEGIIVARATNVTETVPGVIGVSWTPPVTATDGGRYALAVRIPAGSGKQGPGSGPALGAVRLGEPAGSFVAGGEDGGLTPVLFDLAIRLLTTTPGAGKVDAGQQATVFWTFLSGGTPNPFNPSTRLEFGLEQTTTIALGIYDVTGRQVRSFGRETLPAGIYQRTWDGRDEHRQPVAAGIYFVRLDAGGERFEKKVILIK